MGEKYITVNLCIIVRSNAQIECSLVLLPGFFQQKSFSGTIRSSCFTSSYTVGLQPFAVAIHEIHKNKASYLYNKTSVVTVKSNTGEIESRLLHTRSYWSRRSYDKRIFLLQSRYQIPTNSP